MKPGRKIALIGNGNVAHHLIGWFRGAGHVITSIYTRNNAVSDKSQVRNSLDYQNENVDFIVISVKDDAVGEIANSLRNTGSAVIVHTSGTIPMDIFADKENYGVLYPLQTLQKEKAIDIHKVPFLIEGNNEAALSKIDGLCASCGIHRREVSSENRLLYHISAVISANFTNFLLHISQKNLASSGLDAAILKPLIEETVSKAFSQGAYESQTGPARRKDLATIDKHISLIEDTNHKEIYRLISESIISEYHG
ncbi:MAG: DUF2520 domain-containing protein [Cyclobacteriaceae bacterium]